MALHPLSPIGVFGVGVSTGRRAVTRLRAVVAFVAVALVLIGGSLYVGPVAAGAAVPGPRLTTPSATLADALRCSGTLASSPIAPVLFLHGTTSNSASDWSWNWNRAFRQRHWAYCDLDLPDSGNGDIQVASEYVVAAIRHMHTTAGRRISIVGHSQGGMIARWALKYWPDTRSDVDDYVGLASSNHGTADFTALCALPVGCPAANWQQRTGSAFLTALNRGPQTFAGISYTEIATVEDEIVTPYTSVFLPAASNVTDTTVQQLCPTEVVDHFGMSYDNAAWLIGVDALTHTGPAKLARISRATCGHLTMPAVDLATFPTNVTAALLQTATSSAQAKNLLAEPALRSYAR